MRRLLLLSVLIVTPAAAQDIPRYAVEVGCRRVVTGENNGSLPSALPPAVVTEAVRQARQSCVDKEQSEYDFLKSVWGRVNLEDRVRCIDHSEHMAAWNYVGLASCVSAALQRQRMQESRPFRY